ncbi:MAG: hypothetical protein ACRDPE_00630 [Solirubrobacterales bacterium]
MRLDDLLSSDPIDVGCDEALRMLDVYVDLMLAGEDPERSFPGITAHLRYCHPCHQDLDGLLAATRESSGGR